MAKANEIKNALKTQGKKEPKTIKQWITEMRPDIESALPSMVSSERFTRMALTAVMMNPKLSECTAKSFMAGLMQSAQLGLEPNTPLGQSYLLPRTNKGKLEVEFQIGYKGLIELAYRTNKFRRVTAHVVYENDEFDYEYGSGGYIKHKPAMKDRGKIIGAYGLFELKNDGGDFIFLPLDDIIEHHAKHAPSYTSSYSPWKKFPHQMYRKTALKEVLKFAPTSTELRLELSTDSTIKHELDKDMTEVPNDNVFDDDIQIVEDDDAIQTEAEEIFPK